jgi:PAS domain S-box-containing protein
MRSCLAALGFVAAAFLVRFLFDPVLHDTAPYLFFTIAILFASAWFGLPAGILATIASIALASFFFVPPRLAWLPMSWESIANLIAFAILATGVLVFVHLIGRSRARELDSREARIASEIREQRLVDAAQDFAIYELDRKGRILTWNKGAERLKGWKREEIIGKPYNILHTPESRAKNAPGRELKIAAETGRFEEEAPRMRKDGSIFAAHVSLFPLRDEDGEVTGFVKVTRDISDRSKAGKAILESRRRMEAIVQSAMDAIITFDEELHIVLFNPAAEKIFGFSSDEILGEQISFLFKERLRAQLDQEFRQFFRSSIQSRRLEDHGSLVALRSTGEEFPFEASLSQVTIGGERVGTIILRDITERKTNEEARALLAREVDHRAKNALAVAQAMVGLTKADTVEEFADTIRGRISSLARAHSLLSQSQWRGAPLDQLIRDELLPYARESQLSINGPKTSCIAGAVQPLSLLFHELATNAVKHGALGRESGHVSIEWELKSKWLVVRWHERGGPEVKAPKREGFGTKLLKQVTGRQLDAKLDFEWDPKGLSVEIRLPSDRFMPAQDGLASAGELDDESHLAPRNGEDRRILLVEDEELVALELSVELSRLGWAIVGPAATLAEAQALLLKPVDAAVLDVNLRGRPVYPVAEALAERQVPFIFCTGYEMVDPEGRFPEVPVIRKPAHPVAVSAALADLLRARAH